MQSFSPHLKTYEPILGPYQIQVPSVSRFKPTIPVRPVAIHERNLLNELQTKLRSPYLLNAALKRSLENSFTLMPYGDLGPNKKIIENMEFLPMDEKSFSKLYKANLPTLAASLIHFRQDSLLHATASQRLKERNQTSVNYIYIDPAIEDSLEFHSNGRETQLYALRGGILDAQGKVYYGNFPRPILIDMVDNLENDYFSRHCYQQGIPLSSPLVEGATAENKRRFKQYLQSLDPAAREHLGIHSPEYVEISSNQTPNIQSIVKKFVAKIASTNLVVKPLGLRGGEDVHILSEVSDTNTNALECIEAVVHANRGALLEHRIPSYPIINEHGKRLDWNIRTIASPNGTFSITARVGNWEQAINKCQGARTLQINDLERLLSKNGLKPGRFEELIKRIEEISKFLATKFNSQYFGLDFIIDPNLKIWIIEGESFYVGGLLSNTAHTIFDESCSRSETGLFARIENFIQKLAIKKHEPLDDTLTKTTYKQAKASQSLYKQLAALSCAVVYASKSDYHAIGELIKLNYQLLKANQGCLSPIERISILEATAVAYENAKDYASASTICKEIKTIDKSFDPLTISRLELMAGLIDMQAHVDLITSRILDPFIFVEDILKECTYFEFQDRSNLSQQLIAHLVKAIPGISTSDIYYLVAAKCHELNNINAALNIVESILVKDPQHPETLQLKEHLTTLTEVEQ